MTPYLEDIRELYKDSIAWEFLKGCNILITGATGLIGSCLVDILMNHPDKDWKVYAMGRNEERANRRFHQYLQDKDFIFIKGDIEKPLQTDVPFHYIIHAASNASPNFFVNNPVEIIKANIYGVANLMEYGMKHQMKRFLYVSSGEVYGNNDIDAFSESDYGYVDILNPRACYPSAKRAAETMAICYGKEYGMDVVIARPCHTYGPYFTEEDNRVYAQFIRNVINGEDIFMKSAGLQYRSWCYVVDCAAALLLLLCKGKSGEAYNIADCNSNVTIKELAEIVAKEGGRQVISKEPTKEEIEGFTVIKKAVFDTSKLASLGWKVQRSLQENIRHAIETILEKVS